jgi:hypothetical protein
MPIKNLSDVRRLPRLGKISLGIKKTSSGGKEYPSEVDYFVVPEVVQKVFGEKPKELRIMFPVENRDVYFQQWYKCYGTSLLKCKGDGEKAWTWDEKGGLSEITCPCAKLEKNECRQIGILQFLMPDVPGAGVWQITTSSRNSIIDINSGIDFVRAIAGRAHMVPLLLKREKMEIQRLEEGKPKKSSHYTLHIDLDNDVSLRQLQRFGRITPETILLPPADESKDDLLYPANGFEPEKKETSEENTEDAKAATASILENAAKVKQVQEKAEFVKAGYDLEALLKNYQKVGGEIGPNQAKRLAELRTAAEVKAAIDFFEARKKHREEKVQEEKKLRDEIPF